MVPVLLKGHLPRNKNNRGFTLFEMIVVMIILAIISVAGSSIFISLVKGQALVSKQSQLFVDSQLTLDRLVKQLRLALPYSLSETNGNRCLKFLPVVASGFYLNEVPDSSNGLPPIGRSQPIAVAPYQLMGDSMGGSAAFLSIGAASNSEIYGGSSDSLASIRVLSPTSISLNQNHRWQRNSVQQRFFITTRAQAFCVVDNQLRYYKNISQIREQVDLRGSYDLLMNSVAASVTTGSRAFRVEDGSNGCQHCVDIQLQFSRQDIQLNRARTVALFYGR